jgi:hypothetical protein
VTLGAELERAALGASIATRVLSTALDSQGGGAMLAIIRCQGR